MEYIRFERNYSPATVRKYYDNMKEFKLFCDSLESEISWNTVDADIIRRWMVSQMNAGKNSRTVNQKLSSVKSFYKFLLRRGYVDKDPAHRVVGPKNAKNLPQFVREAEMDRLLDGDYFADDYNGRMDRLMMTMFYETGIRRSELKGLDLADVSLTERQLKVTGKRNKQRIVPFGEELQHALEAYLEERSKLEVEMPEPQALYINRNSGRRLSDASIAKIVRKYLSFVTTLKKRSPHVLRHSFATSMLNHNANLQSVKELLGHESLATTEIYTHTTFEELKEMYNQAHPRAPKNVQHYGDEDSGDSF